MDKVITAIYKIDDSEELRNIVDAARKRIAVLSNINFGLGSKVQLITSRQNTRPYDTVGTVTKKNRKTFSVNFGEYGDYKVPKGILQKPL